MKSSVSILFKLSLMLFIISCTALTLYYGIEFIANQDNSIRMVLQNQANQILFSNLKLANISKQQEENAYENQIKDLQLKVIEETKKQLESEIEQLKSTENNQLIEKVNSLYTQYNLIIEKLNRNTNEGLNTQIISNQLSSWGITFLERKYDELASTFETTTKSLDSQHTLYLASLPSPTPKPTAIPVKPQAPTLGYNYQLVTTNQGNFYTYYVKLPLSQYAVKTITANLEECSNNCPAKSLADYTKENNAYAGMNGTYFCPPDYASCANSTYSTDFAVYNSNLNTWFKAVSLKWNDLGLAAFNGSTPLFFQESKTYGNEPITAGIVNFPSLLKNGNYAVNEASLSSYQKDQRGTRGAIGTDGVNIYLALVTNATVIDAAYVMQAIGCSDALNLDGGGSSALYINGSYKVGPGRLLPNVVLLIPK